MLSTLPASTGSVARSQASLPRLCSGVLGTVVRSQVVQRSGDLDNLRSQESEVNHLWEEGLLGCFAGLIPRLLGDIISLWLCDSLAYLVNTYALDSGVSTMNEMKSYSRTVTGFFASMLTYPFVLVSNLILLVDSLLTPHYIPLG
ncbi:mitochondrial carrier homolog 2-like [Dipodomys spectabilis]|uniref:mitochondrial carrier homolog 2-like n=1 Tax=Dipodomys spectabilis TaxID=105255 RepID=UPI001C53D7DC|nr:mitochondrial carrier homolog 2-like [Dipodomys spectabilis]